MTRHSGRTSLMWSQHEITLKTLDIVYVEGRILNEFECSTYIKVSMFINGSFYKQLWKKYDWQSSDFWIQILFFD